VTPQEAGACRGLLEAERERISGAIASLHENGRRALDDEASDLGGVGADTASMTYDRELDEGLEEGALHTLAQVNRALQRLEDGSYGTCERCGKQIGSERLRARPWATLCIDDQRNADRG
jgi:RNA polymerase-binding transcription factor